MKKIFLLFACSICLLTARTQTGTIDPSFGTNGISVTDFGVEEPTTANIGHKIFKYDNAYYILVQINNRIAISKYSLNGVLDINYGIKGYSTVGSADANNWYYLQDAVLQNDGKIVILSHRQLIRTDLNGELDAGFGIDGKLEIGLSTDHWTYMHRIVYKMIK